MDSSVLLADVWITCRYYASKDYSEFLGPKHKIVLAKQKVFWQNAFCFAKKLSVSAKHLLLCQNTICFAKTISVFICWAFSSVSERNYFKATYQKAFS